jgi:hypothetical protein
MTTEITYPNNFTKRNDMLVCFHKAKNYVETGLACVFQRSSPTHTFKSLSFWHFGIFCLSSSSAKALELSPVTRCHLDGDPDQIWPKALISDQ